MKPNIDAPAKVLVVDDDPLTVKNLRRILGREGFEVVTAASGVDALEQLDAQRFDLVLTDLVMRDIDGLAVLDRAKSLAPETEVVVFTGHASIDSAIDAIRRQAFHYLQKPLHPEEVRHITRRAMEKRLLRGEVTKLRRRTTAMLVSWDVGHRGAVCSTGRYCHT